MRLSALTNAELLRLDAALTALDEALVMLEDAGAANAEDGVDLIELSEALVQELGRRTMEDAEYRVKAAISSGECVPVVRPDGQTGYMPARE
jgi:hypothetical protein